MKRIVLLVLCAATLRVNAQTVSTATPSLDELQQQIDRAKADQASAARAAARRATAARAKRTAAAANAQPLVPPLPEPSSAREPPLRDLRIGMTGFQVNDGGKFVKLSGDAWENLPPPGNTCCTYAFQQVDSSLNQITLYDSSRHMWMRVPIPNGLSSWSQDNATWSNWEYVGITH